MDKFLNAILPAEIILEDKMLPLNSIYFEETPSYPLTKQGKTAIHKITLP